MPRLGREQMETAYVLKRITDAGVAVWFYLEDRERRPGCGDGTGPQRPAGAALGLVTIFLPGILLHLGTLPFWESFRRRAGTQAVMRGINAAVVGLLGAALYSPIWTSSVKGRKTSPWRWLASSCSWGGRRRRSSSSR